MKKNTLNEIECGIIHLQNDDQVGSHWTAYHADKNFKYYFDSFGCHPPIEMMNYLGCQQLLYTTGTVQQYNNLWTF